MKEQDLTLVGLTEDGTKLVLVSDTGEKFHLAADDKLLATLPGGHPRAPRAGQASHSQLENKMESALRPRDIQARIRSGESPESVAAAAQMTIDKVMGYATPVLAERAHIAERAQRASVRRKGGEGSSRQLGDAVAERLRSHNVDPGSVEWDAWRREDGRWTLVADYRSKEGPAHAEFIFDAPGRYVVAEDEEARWLVGESARAAGTQAQAPATAQPGRRLAAVADEQLPLGEDAIGLVQDTPETEVEETTVDLTVTARAVREQKELPTELSGATGDADWIATQASDRPASKQAEEPEPEPAEEPAQEPVAEAAPARKAARKSRGRASVPSWDEIMFGGGKRE